MAKKVGVSQAQRDAKESNDKDLLRKQIEMQRARINTLEAELVKRMSEMQSEIDYWRKQTGVDPEVNFWCGAITSDGVSEYSIFVLHFI